MSAGWRVLSVVLLSLVLIFSGLVLLIVLFAPRATEEQYDEFAVCGEHFNLAPGFVAFDYGSRYSADRFPGDRVYFIRAESDDTMPPAIFDQIFTEIPDSVSRLLDGSDYQEWLGRFDTDRTRIVSGPSPGGRVEYGSNCAISLALLSQTDIVYPRSGDWAVLVSCAHDC